MAERLHPEPISAIYVTNLRRTAETAAPLCARLGLTPRVEPDLREVHLGEWEGGLFRIKAAQQDPIYLALHEQERWDVIPGAESHEALSQRIRPALLRIASRHPDECVAAVVHGGVIAHVLAAAAQARPFAFMGAENGSISRLIIHEERMLVRGFNDVAHLYDLASGPQGLS